MNKYREMEETALRTDRAKGLATPYIPVVGMQVICNGYDGTIQEVYKGGLEGMVLVRLDNGSVGVSASFPDCYPTVAPKTKDEAFDAGEYVFNPPPSCHLDWDREIWMEYVTYTVPIVKEVQA